MHTYLLRGAQWEVEVASKQIQRDTAAFTIGWDITGLYGVLLVSGVVLVKYRWEGILTPFAAFRRLKHSSSGISNCSPCLHTGESSHTKYIIYSSLSPYHIGYISKLISIIKSSNGLIHSISNMTLFWDLIRYQSIYNKKEFAFTGMDMTSLDWLLRAFLCKINGSNNCEKFSAI